MKKAVLACIACTWSVASFQASHAQDAPSRAGAASIETIITEVARTTGKEFIVDPRVRAEVWVIRKDASALSYADLLAILQVHGFTAVEGDRFTRIVPDASVRQLALPVATTKQKFDDFQHITKVIPVRSTPAAHLVPLLRPLLPQQAHLAASICTNDLMIVDTAANVSRIEALVATLDKGEPYKPTECLAPMAAAEPRQ